MSEEIKPALPDAAALFGELKLRWGWLLALGIVSLLLGTIGFGMGAVMTAASIQFFGILLLVGGGAQIGNAFQCKGWKGMALNVVIGLLYIAAGGICLMDPLGASGILTLGIAGILMAVGATRVVMAIQHKGHKGWLWILIAGLLAIALGVMIVVQWPSSALWVIGLFVSIELVFNGWALVFLALAARNAGEGNADSHNGSNNPGEKSPD